MKLFLAIFLIALLIDSALTSSNTFSIDAFTLAHLNRSYKATIKRATSINDVIYKHISFYPKIFDGKPRRHLQPYEFARFWKLCCELQLAGLLTAIRKQMITMTNLKPHNAGGQAIVDFLKLYDFEEACLAKYREIIDRRTKYDTIAS